MRDEPTEITVAEYRRLTSGRNAPKRGRASRPDIPAAPADEKVGMTPLLIAGWAYTFFAARQTHRFTRGVLDTGECDTLKAACDAAKRLRKEYELS